MNSNTSEYPDPDCLNYVLTLAASTQEKLRKSKSQDETKIHTLSVNNKILFN